MGHLFAKMYYKDRLNMVSIDPLQLHIIGGKIYGTTIAYLHFYNTVSGLKNYLVSLCTNI